MSAFLAGLGGIFYTMLAKLIGYEFVTRTVVIGLKSWAESTKTKNDDKVVEAMADAWEVPIEKIKSLGE